MPLAEQNKKSVPRYFTPDRGAIRKCKDREFYGYTFEEKGLTPMAMAIDIIKEDGNRMAIQYHEIASPIIFDISGMVKLKVSIFEIIIRGKNLKSIYEYILEHRLVWIKENDSSFTEVKEDEPLIESIEIKEN